MSPFSRAARRSALTVGVVAALAVGLAGSGSATERPALDLLGADWPTWSKDSGGSRHAGSEFLINQHTVGQLKVKWAYAYPKGVAPRSQPAVVGNTIYFGSPDGTVHAANARTGKAKWTFDLAGVEPTEAARTITDSPSVSGRTVVIGSPGRLTAIDRFTGEARWSKRLDTNPSAILTSSPTVYRGKVYVGVSSGENTLGKDHACCTFRGHVDALDLDTGKLDWRRYTVPKPKQVGTWPGGAKKYEPSGAGVWSSPVIDRRTGTLYVGTGQNYTGSGGDFDTLLALDTDDGSTRWKNQVTKADTWRSLCNDPEPEGYCPGLADGSALDYDIGATPNLFEVDGRPMVGVGQKLGVYHAFDARTGEVVWRRQLGRPLPSGGIGGIQWGSSYDGERLYISTYFADPGTVFAVDPGTGKVLWEKPNPADGCTTGGAAEHPESCVLAQGSAASTTRDLVFEGSNDGKLRAYRSRDGKVLWTHDTIQDVPGVNGKTGRGGAVAGPGAGAVISRGMVYVNSGYFPAYPSEHGPVLLAFGF